MYIGVDYYPEHWPQERWATDARMMREAGFNVVRMGEFAWVDFEPSEGRFDFDWLDRSLAILQEQGISAILGTPTAVMPAWMQHNYPETMATEANGQRTVWGVRKNNCMSSNIYRAFSQKITRAMAEHYKSTPNVIGWQTDNEFGGPICYCESCRGQFITWLQERYGSLEAVNRAWGTHFWGQKYTNWDQMILPVNDTGYNPSLLLDWKRFNSYLNVSFQAEQVKILREVCPNQFVTHNLMGLFPELNYYALAKDLDFVSWDNYAVIGARDKPTTPAAGADLMRSLKRKNFWIMETTAGPAGWGTMGRNPRPGEIRRVALQQVAHGCDSLVWFRWRTCTAGREQYWHGLLGHDGKPFRRYREAAQTAADMRKLDAEMQGTTVKADVAIIHDYESQWALTFQPAYDATYDSEKLWTDRANNYRKAMLRYYQALFRAGINVDMVPPGADLSGYKAVLAPHLYILTDQVANQLVEYVRQGGVLLADPRTAVKDATSLMHDRTLPGLLSEPLGIAIEEYEAMVHGMTYTVTGKGAMQGEFRAQLFCDWTSPRGAEVLAGFRDWHMQTYAAVTRNHFGAGWGYYVSVISDQEAFYDQVVADVLAHAGISAVVTPPPGVEVSVRSGAGKKLIFVINHTEETKSLAVPAGLTDLLSGQTTGSEIHLERHGVAVLKQ